MNSNYNYLLRAARHSKGSCRHWMRYLCKVIKPEKISVTEEDFHRLVESGELSVFQKLSLHCAMQPGSPTHEYVLSLNRKADTSRIDALLKQYGILKGESN